MRLHHTERAPAGLVPKLGLLLLSGLWAVASLSPDLLAHFSGDTISPALRQAGLYFAFAAVAAFTAMARRLDFPRGRIALACAGVGLGLFVIPSALVFFAEDTVSTLDRVAAFSLTPVFAVILEPYLQGDFPRRGKGALAGSMCAVGGIVFLFPLDVPGTFRAGTALCLLAAAALCIAVTNCYAVRVARTLASGSVLPMAAQAGAVSALCFAVTGAITPHDAGRWSALPRELLEPFAIDLPALFLLFWLMRHLAASRMTARFVIAPLFTILVGLALQPTSPPERVWLGMALLAGGAGWLVFAPAEQIEGSELAPLSELISDSTRRLPPDS